MIELEVYTIHLITSASLHFLSFHKLLSCLSRIQMHRNREGLLAGLFASNFNLLRSITATIFKIRNVQLQALQLFVDQLYEVPSTLAEMIGMSQRCCSQYNTCQ